MTRKQANCERNSRAMKAACGLSSTRATSLCQAQLIGLFVFGTLSAVSNSKYFMATLVLCDACRSLCLPRRAETPVDRPSFSLRSHSSSRALETVNSEYGGFRKWAHADTFRRDHQHRSLTVRTLFEFSLA